MSDTPKVSADNKIIGFKRELKYITTVDAETGEVISHVKMRDKHKKLGVGWLATYQHGAAILATLPLTGEQHKVLWALIAKLDFDNYIHVSQTELAELTGIDRSNINRAIKALISNDVIVEGPRAGLHKTYRLNPNIGHKGSNIEQTVVEYEQLKQLQEKKRQAKLAKQQAKTTSDTVTSDV